MTLLIETRDQAKARARAIRTEAASKGTVFSHAATLEQVAGELGYRNWSTLCAALPETQEGPFEAGDRVQGIYLKQEFSGFVLKVRQGSKTGTTEVSLALDSPVDVIGFKSFSNLRQRITATISRTGVSDRKTGDGVPHLVLSKARQAEK